MVERTQVTWTGHPLLDIGVAALCVMTGKSSPGDLTLDDLDGVADELEAAFSLKWMNAYLTCLYPNGAFTNPTMGTATRKAEADRALRTHRNAPHVPGALRCAFSGQPAVDILDRRHVPLLSGAGVISFTPFGMGGLPVANWISLALHAFAFGARRALGRALAVHSDSREILIDFVAKNVSANRVAVLAAKTATEGKYPDAKAPLTFVISTLCDVFRERRRATYVGEFASLLVYHLSNSGQGADIDIYELDSCVVRFISRAQSEKYRDAFGALMRRMWRCDEVKEGRGTKTQRYFVEPDAPDPVMRRNYLYEDLFRLPREADRFVRTHFLGRRASNFETEDPRSRSRLRERTSSVSWELIDLFLLEVLGMNKNRIEAIRAMGDRLAVRINDQKDRKLLRALLTAKRYGDVRARLVRAAADELRAGRDLLMGLDTFLLVFEEGGELVRVDWSLARDLLCIRVLEELHRMKASVLDTELPEEPEDEDASASSGGRLKEEQLS